MITPEAIERLEQPETVKAALKALADAGLDGQLLPLPGGITLHNLENFHPHRTSMRGIMATPAPDHFFKFCKGIALERAACFVNAEKMSAETIFDLGDTTVPGHAKHRAVLRLESTAEYKALLKTTSGRQNQKSLAEWMEDWRDGLTAYDEAGEPLNIKNVIAAVRSIDIKALRNVGSDVQNLKAERSALESVSVESKHTLPTALVFGCVPFQGLKSHNFKLRLSASTGGDEISLLLQIIQHEKEVQDIADEFAQLVAGSLEGLNVFVGTYDAK